MNFQMQVINVAYYMEMVGTKSYSGLFSVVNVKLP